MSLLGRFARTLAGGVAGKPVAPQAAAELAGPGQRVARRCVLKQGDVRVVYSAHDPVLQWRIDNLFVKEPITMAWIASMRSGAVLYDVGANVGMYTVWAAATRGVRVHAFEPESQNYAVLNENIVANGLSERVRAYCLAIGMEERLDVLHLSKFSPGGSCHTFGANLDFSLRERPATAHQQGALCVTLDSLVQHYGLPPPEYLKVDVDGLEHHVMAGAKTLLQSGSIRSILIEINRNLPEHQHVVSGLEAMGYRYRPEQVESAVRKSGAFTNVGEYLFER